MCRLYIAHVVYIPFHSLYCCLQDSLAQSEETIITIQEKNEAALKQFEEEKAIMKSEVEHLELRLQEACEQQQESKVNTPRIEPRSHKQGIHLPLE